MIQNSFINLRFTKLTISFRIADKADAQAWARRNFYKQTNAPSSSLDESVFARLSLWYDVLLVRHP